MARVLAIGMLLLCGSCATWRVGTTMDLRASDNTLLVITQDRAYVLEINRIKNGRLSAKAKRIWAVRSAKTDDPEGDPDDLADRLGWKLLFTGSFALTLETSTIRHVEVYEPRG